LRDGGDVIAERTRPVRIPANNRGMDRYIYTMTLKNSLHGFLRIPPIFHDMEEFEVLPPGNLFQIPVSKVEDDGGSLKYAIGILVVMLLAVDSRRIKDQNHSITG
jgi:hypothetical protein